MALGASPTWSSSTSCPPIDAASIGDAYFTATSPDDPYEFFAELQGTYYAEQGTQFQYSGANTFILGWLVEEVMGMPFQDALTREIWRKTGMEGDGAMMAPRFGVPNWTWSLPWATAREV